MRRTTQLIVWAAAMLWVASSASAAPKRGIRGQLAPAWNIDTWFNLPGWHWMGGSSPNFLTTSQLYLSSFQTTFSVLSMQSLVAGAEENESACQWFVSAPKAQRARY